MRLVELWYVGGDWSEKGDSRGLHSIPVDPSDRVQLFAPVLARKLILVLANQTGAYEAPPQGEVKARRIALEVGQAQDDEPQVASGAWQYLLDAEQPRLYTVEGPLQLETTLAQIDSPTLQLECELEEISEAGSLLDLGNSTRYLQWKDYAGGTEAFNLVLDPKRLWTRTGNPLEGLGLPLTAGTYHLCLSGAAAGGWTTQQGPSGTLAIWSKLLWMWWDDGEEHDGPTTDREVKGDADIFGVSDPAAADEFFSFTLKRDTTVWFYLPAAREPAHSFPIHAVLTSDNQRTTTATYRPGEWVELPVDSYSAGVRSVPSRLVSSTNNAEQAVDSVFLDLSSCGQPSRAWVYVREDGRWHFVQELLVADQQRFQVPINRARVTRLRLFFPPTPAAMPSWQSSGDVWPQRILVQEPSFLEIGPEVKEGALITGRQPWRRGMYVLSFEDSSQLKQSNDPNWPGSLLHARNFQLCPYKGPMTVEVGKSQLLAPGEVVIKDNNPSATDDGQLENWATEGHEFEMQYLAGKTPSVRMTTGLSTNAATPSVQDIALSFCVRIAAGKIDFSITLGTLTVKFTDTTTIQPGWHRLRLIQYNPWKYALYHMRGGSWVGLAFFDLQSQAGSWSTAAATWTGSVIAAGKNPVRRLSQYYNLVQTALRKLITYNTYTWDIVPTVTNGVLPHKFQMVGAVAKTQHVVFLTTQKSLDGLPYATTMPPTYISLNEEPAHDVDGKLVRSLPVWLEPEDDVVNPSFGHYDPEFRKPLLEVGAFSDPLWHCGLSQVSGASAYTADGEWSASGGAAVVTPEAIGPDGDWMVELDMRFDMDIAPAAGKDSDLTLRFAEGPARYADLTISRPVYSYSDTGWWKSDTGVQNLAKNSSKIIYTLSSHNNQGGTNGTSFCYADPTAAEDSGVWRVVKTGSLLSVFRKDAGGVFQPVVGFKLDTASAGVPIVTASGSAALAGYRNTSANNWKQVSLVKTSVQLAGATDKRAFARNLKVYAYSRDDHRLRVTRAADGQVVQDLADPAFLFGSDGAITHHYYSGAMNPSPDAFDALSLMEKEKLHWVQTINRKDDLVPAEAVIRLPNYGFLSDPATARSLQRVVEGSSGLLQIFDGSRKLVLRKEQAGGKWLLDKPARIELLPGSTLWVLNANCRLYPIQRRSIHLSGVTVALDGAPALRSAQTRYSLEWAGRGRKILPSPQKSTRGIAFPLERGAGGALELSLDPPTGATLAASPDAAALKAAGITVVDADQVLTCGSDFTWQHDPAADKLTLLGDGFGAPRLFYPVAASARSAAYDFTQSDWTYARMSMDVTGATSIDLTSNVFPPPAWLYLQAKPRQPRQDGAFVVSGQALFVLRCWIDGRFIPDMTDYFDWSTPNQPPNQLACWTDGRKVYFSKTVTGKLQVTWTSLPEKFRLVARIEQPGGLVRSWPRFTVRTSAAYYKPNRR